MGVKKWILSTCMAAEVRGPPGKLEEGPSWPQAPSTPTPTATGSKGPREAVWKPLPRAGSSPDPAGG